MCLIDNVLADILAQPDTERCLNAPKHDLVTGIPHKAVQAACKRLGITHTTGDSTSRNHDWAYSVVFTPQEAMSLAKSA